MRRYWSVVIAILVLLGGGVIGYYVINGCLVPFGGLMRKSDRSF